MNPKFIQIAIDPAAPEHNGTVYALDSDGTVWYLTSHDEAGQWIPLPSKRMAKA